MGGLYDASENPKRALSGKAANGQDVKFKFSKLVVCADSLDVEAGTVGITPKDSHSIGQMGTVKFKGTINDAGEGEFQYLDKAGNPSGQKFTLKFSDSKAALIQTDKVSAAVIRDPFMSFTEPKEVTADLDAGSYNVVCDF